MADVWSNDPDRTTRNGDTRTSEQVTAETFRPRCTCGATVTGDLAVHLREHYYGPVEDAYMGFTRYSDGTTKTVVRDATGEVVSTYPASRDLYTSEGWLSG